MRILCFEDAATANLAPITTARPAYAITCASYRLLDWLRRLEDSTIIGSVRPHLHTIQRVDYGLSALSDELLSADLVGEPLLLVNARLVPSAANQQALAALIAGGAGCHVADESGLVAALLPGDWQVPPPPAESDPLSLTAIDHVVAAAQLQPQIQSGLSVFHWPHDVVAWHMRLMPENMQQRIRGGQYTQLEDGVFVAEGATIGPYAVMDTAEGPIVLDQNVTVGPYCYFSGPVYAGPHTRVIEHAALKDGVSLGHTVKIGGEVEASVIESYTNKQHHGFLGHSYLGSWINLGAGTCNSDLKNTYGKINVEYNGQRVATNMQFMGCIMGDYSKSAINTGIFTGKVIGVGSMLYGFVTSNVPSFVNYARLFGQMAEIPPEVMINTQARMFSRRKVQQRDCDTQLMRDMFRLTASEREQSEDLSLL